jgi:PBP4 family serine-type D-alanyl-D-alanine carboxypeptidase
MPTLRRTLIGVVTAGALAAVATPALAAPLGPPTVASLEQTMSLPRYANSTWGVSVADATTGESLYSRNANQMFVPGSVTKSFSLATTLASYPYETYRFRTPVYRRGPVTKGVVRDLVLVGSGDFSFGTRETSKGTLAFNSSDHNEANSLGLATLLPYNPLRVLNKLARQVRASGIRQVSGDVAIDNRLWKPYDGWPDGQIGSIWVNENLIDVTTTPTRSGRPATIDWRPKTPAYRVVSNVVTSPRGTPTNLTVTKLRSGVLRISGRIPAGGGPAVRNYLVDDPAAFARSAFIQSLRRAGVTVNAPATGDNPESVLPRQRRYPAAARLARHVSPPLAQYARVVLKVSYNRGADLMVCLSALRAGSRDCPDGIARGTKVLGALGVPMADQVVLFDGAGSDDHNRFSPNAVNALNRAIATQPFGRFFRANLPNLGVSGDLDLFGANSPAKGKLQAKTGTRAATSGSDQVLTLQRGLSGYLTGASGRELLVTIFANNFQISGISDLLAAANDQIAMVDAIYLGT